MEGITERKLLDMKLHDDTAFNTSTMSIIILKVVGGWIYWRTHDDALAGVFIPEPKMLPKQN